MAKALVRNNAVGTLASGITTGSLSITLSAGQGGLFPNPSGGDYFFATLVDSLNNIEIVKCTARVGDVLTVMRGQDGTSARAYGAGDFCELRPTAALFNDKAPIDSPEFTGTVLMQNPLAVEQGGTGATAAAAARANLGAQSQDPELDALSTLSTTGLVARTGSSAYTARTILAGSSKVTVNNGAGVAGNPSIDVSEAALTLDNLGGTLSVNKGGTGSTTAAGARTNLDVPTRSGGDASGTWNINISGNAGTVTNPFPSGTRLAFQQTTAPVGWTKEASATYNDAALRVVTGVVGTGGADAFSTHFGTGKSTAGHTLAVGEIPAHSHGINDPTHNHSVNDPGHSHTVNVANNQDTGAQSLDSVNSTFNTQTTSSATTGISLNASGTGISIQNAGGGGAHSHTLNNFNIKYVDFIIATKD